MRRILIIYYSQSGDTRSAIHAMAQCFSEAGLEVTCQEIEPVQPHPFPWKSTRRFFGVMPACVGGDGQEVKSLQLAECPELRDLCQDDLVLLAYPVWFLSPALPMQGFLASADAQALRGKRVATLTICRNMWRFAERIVQAELQRVGAHTTGGYRVTHQGSPLVNVITTPYRLLTGRRSKKHQQHSRHIQAAAQHIARQVMLCGNPTKRLATLRYSKENFHEPNDMSDAFHIDVFAPAEAFARPCFVIWGKLMCWAEKRNLALRNLTTALFEIWLVATIVFGFSFLVLLHPLHACFRHWSRR